MSGDRGQAPEHLVQLLALNWVPPDAARDPLHRSQKELDKLHLGRVRLMVHRIWSEAYSMGQVHVYAQQAPVLEINFTGMPEAEKRLWMQRLMELSPRTEWVPEGADDWPIP